MDTNSSENDSSKEAPGPESASCDLVYLSNNTSSDEPEAKKLKEDGEAQASSVAAETPVSKLKESTVEFKNSFLAIVSGLHGSIDGYVIGEQEQAKTSAETAVNHLLESGKNLDTLLNRQQIAFIAKRPDKAIEEEITQLRREIFNKKRTLEKHEAMMNSTITILSNGLQPNPTASDLTTTTD